MSSQCFLKAKWEKLLSLLDAQWIHIFWKVVQHLNLVQTIPFFIWITLPTNGNSHKPILHPRKNGWRMLLGLESQNTELKSVRVKICQYQSTLVWMCVLYLELHNPILVFPKHLATLVTKLCKSSVNDK